MNVVIVGSSIGYPHAAYIGNEGEKAEEIERAYRRCVDDMLESEDETVAEVTILYNGQIYTFEPEKQLIEFFKTI